MWRMALAAVAAVVSASAGGATGAPPCDAALADWEVLQGTLAPAERCGAFIGTTSGGYASFSYGEYGYRPAVALPYELSLDWQRLGPEAKSLELRLGGAILLLKDGAYGLYVDDVLFDRDSWQPLPGFSARARHHVTVRQDHESVTLVVDGKTLRRFALDTPEASAHVAVAFKGARAYRSRMWFADVSVKSLAH
jgi:hypothetical protein